MKSPAELSAKLKKQWNNNSKREFRLLGGTAAWPISEPIGIPKAAAISNDLDAVVQHVKAWKNVSIGEVVWQEVSYRATSEPVEVPCRWQFNKPSEWVKACRDQTVQKEFDAMATLVNQTLPVFHPLLIKRRSLWQGKPLNEVIQACAVAATLNPGDAQGKPLRTLSLKGIDTKFFERHAHLVTRLLDTRFEDEVSAIGLEAFLGALQEGDHWLLLIDLDGGLLPFKRQRVSSVDLAKTVLPGSRLLIVENESCIHQLASLKNTLAVLGAGFDLDWTANPELQKKSVGYWGDIDTWGLKCLASARANLPKLQALLMKRECFNAHQHLAVPEPVVAGTEIPGHLNQAEQALYQFLLSEEAGRLEQEFLPVELVQAAMAEWGVL